VKVFDGLDEFVAATGRQLGPTDWLSVEQDRVNKFADATDDHQWIHVGPEQAAGGPFGGTINYGLNKVRFITPRPGRRQGASSVRDCRCAEAGRCVAGDTGHHDRGRRFGEARRGHRIDPFSVTLAGCCRGGSVI